MNAALWTVQWLLGLLFLWAGGFKLVAPIEQLAGPVAFPEWFLRFIGLCEVLGGIGLVLPGLVRIRPELVPLAAAGLVILMIGAVGTTLAGGMGAVALFPLFVGVLLVFVAWGRWRVVPLGERRAAPDAEQPVR